MLAEFSLLISITAVMISVLAYRQARKTGLRTARDQAVKDKARELGWIV